MTTSDFSLYEQDRNHVRLYLSIIESLMELKFDLEQKKGNASFLEHNKKRLEAVDLLLYDCADEVRGRRLVDG